MELLLVSHKGIASGMKTAIAMVMGPAAQQITAMELTEEEGIDQFSKRLEEYLIAWLSGTGKGLIFADLRGGTPYNQAELLLTKHGLKDRAKVISGMNLPMVVEAALRDMDVCDTGELTGLVQAARDGIMCLDLEAQAAGSDDE
ncbi:MAG: hypothetical protein KH230_00240 [Enterocloster asparagiformis]|nr:hypothetical protein [Enterocloster asparagiformis]